MAMQDRKKIWMITALVPILLIVGLVSSALLRSNRVMQARRAWKEEAIAVILQLANDHDGVQKEKAHIARTDTANDPSILAEKWLSNRMILMMNGEWLVYRNHCPKEALKPGAKPQPYVSDIFLAKGSNGKWYYSTCHFCVGMMVIVGEDPPPSIEAFARRYHLREFDGESDECLQQTDFMPGRNWD
jgi:hypothetical protein